MKRWKMIEYDDDYDKMARFMNKIYSEEMEGKSKKSKKNDEEIRNEEIIDLIAKELKHCRNAVRFHNSEIPVAVVKDIIKIWDIYKGVQDADD